MSRWFSLLALIISLGAAAQPYPSRPIRFVVPQAPGSTADIVARIASEKVARTLGQPIIVDNRPGAGGNIATEIVGRAAPDGYTIGMATIATHAINPALFRAVPFDPLADFAPIALLGTAPCVLIVHPSNPAGNVAQLIDWVRARPHVTFGSGGNGNAQHLAGELFATMAGVKLVHVPYKGAAQAVTAVMTGEVDLMFPNIPLAQAHVDGGRLKSLGVTSTMRVASLPAVPPISETLKGFEVMPWFSVAGPARLPAALVQQLNAAFSKAIESPEARELLARQGFEVKTTSPGELAAFMQSELAKWSRVVKQSGASVD